MQRAEVALEKAEELNPLVRVRCETTALATLADEFFHAFSAICLVGADKQTQVRPAAAATAAGGWEAELTDERTDRSSD